MKVGLIGSTTVSLAKVVGLVRKIKPVRLACGQSKQWALLVEGRGFARLLRQDVLPPSPDLIRPAGWDTPRPETFHSKPHAERYVAGMGWKKKRGWIVVR